MIFVGTVSKGKEKTEQKFLILLNVHDLNSSYSQNQKWLSLVGIPHIQEPPHVIYVAPASSWLHHYAVVHDVHWLTSPWRLYVLIFQALLWASLEVQVKYLFTTTFNVKSKYITSTIGSNYAWVSFFMHIPANTIPR